VEDFFTVLHQEEKHERNKMKNFQRLLFIGLLLSGFIVGTIQAQTVDEIYSKFIKGYHTYQSTTLPYHVFTPDNYNPQIHYPLVLCLHGLGECGDNSSAVKLNSMATVWARDSNQTRWPCFILVPQCKIGHWWPDSDMILTVNDILDSLLREFSIDTNRLFVTGLSMGGYGTWDIITRFPDKFAAAIPVCGVGDPSKAASIKHIPIWDFHGALDYTVPVAGSREMIAALENAGDTVVYTHCHLGDCTGLPENIIAEKIRNGAKLLYTEYASGGHSIWDQAYNTIFLLPWTFSQSKAQGPTSTEKEYVILLPENSCLLQNFPNPFNPITNIPFFVGKNSYTSLRVYDVLGREVATVFSGELPAGSYSQQWNAQNFPSGVYFYHLSAGSFTQTKKLVLLK
jgi:poly(3-hydroxybutyrate) depolymerase